MAFSIGELIKCETSVRLILQKQFNKISLEFYCDY